MLACISPLCFGHVLFVPDRAKLRPQALTTELISCGLQLLTASKRSDFRALLGKSKQMFSLLSLGIQSYLLKRYLDPPNLHNSVEHITC